MTETLIHLLTVDPKRTIMILLGVVITILPYVQGGWKRVVWYLLMVGALAFIIAGPISLAGI